MKLLLSTSIYAVKTERKLAKKALIEKKNMSARLKKLLREKRNASFLIYTHCFVTLNTEVRKLPPKTGGQKFPILKSGRPLDDWLETPAKLVAVNVV